MKISKNLTLGLGVLALGLHTIQAQDSAPKAAEEAPKEEAKAPKEQAEAENAPKPASPEDRRAAALDTMVDRFFGNADADSDGKITSEEYAKHSQKDIEQRFKQVDSNQDGSIEKSELKATLQNQANRRRNEGGPRPNGDGFRRPERGPRPDGDGSERPERGPRPDGDGADRPERGPRGEGPGRGGRGGFGGNRMQEMDADGDGYVTKEEYLKASEAQFNTLDRDGKGKFSLEELRERFRGGPGRGERP